MAGKGKGRLKGCLWFFVIVLVLAGIGAFAGNSSDDSENDNAAANTTETATVNASDKAAAPKSESKEASVTFSVDTDGAPTDGWPLFVSVSGMDDQQIDPSGGTIEADAGSHTFKAADAYFIASDGSLLQCADVTPSTAETDGGSTTHASVKLTKVDPSSTERAEYQADIDAAYQYLQAHVGQDEADELKAAAEKLLPPENAPPADNGKLTATFIDVGQGDASLVQLPDGKNLLIDAGPSSGASAVTSTLRSLGVSRIDYLVATHPDADHIGGMATVIGSFDIGEIWAPNATNNTRTFEEFLDAVDAKGMTITAGYRGRNIVAPGTASYSLETLGPASQEETTNESSLVIRATYGSTTFLFTGDADAGDIVSDCPSHVDVLKVSHHGSKTGTTTSLARTLSPKIAVISYDVDNSYGHPTQQCLDALSGVGAQVYGTGANGSVTVTSDGTSVTASPARQGTVVAGDHEEEKPSASTSASAPSKSSSSSSSSDTSGSSAATTPSATTTAPSSSEDQNDVVYVTASGRGERYHRQDCRTLSRSKNVVSLTRAQAEAQGYTPCKVCKP